MTFNITTLNIMSFSRMTLSMTTFNIMLFNITTLYIMSLSRILLSFTTQHNVIFQNGTKVNVSTQNDTQQNSS